MTYSSYSRSRALLHCILLVLAGVISADAPHLVGGKLEVLEGLEIVWETPSERPRALLTVFHRGGRSALAWWDKSPGCPSCQGMPEEKKIVQAALSWNLAVIAVSAHDTKTYRWEVADGNTVAHGLVALTTARRWRGLPLFALGVGCGAGFIATVLPQALPLSMKLSGMHLQLMADQAGLKASVINTALTNGQGVVGAGWHGGPKATLGTPPAGRIVVSHMPRDEAASRAARAIAHSWTKRGAAVLEQRSLPLPLHAKYFFDSIAGVSEVESAAVVSMLQRGGYLSTSGFLLTDPQRSAWRSVISAPIGRHGAHELGMLRAVTKDALSLFTSPIAEELNRAYGLAEVCGENMNATMDFFTAELVPKSKPARGSKRR